MNAIEPRVDKLDISMNSHVDNFTFGLTSYSDLSNNKRYWLVPGGSLVTSTLDLNRYYKLDGSGVYVSNIAAVYPPSIGVSYKTITFKSALVTLNKSDATGGFLDSWGDISGSCVNFEIVAKGGANKTINLSYGLVGGCGPFEVTIPADATIDESHSISVSFQIENKPLRLLQNGFHINLTLRTASQL